ncbi:hypothetical protein ACFYNO_32730 [Kitasatospora sp. NPDC006697]|uniref:hypothetical protein n=1 Tax=Kitasatospora sp. NPDC006697 TaxID=3364020 RepID=UPI0036BA3EE7
MTPVPVTPSPLLTDWITAGATGFAALGTVGAFIVGLCLYRREAARDEKQRERERRSQARLVYGYAMIRERPQPEGAETSRTSPAFVIINSSDQPIYEVTLVKPGTRTDSHYTVIHPGGERIEWMGSSDARHLGVGGRLIVPVSFDFTDSDTVRWHRGPQGELVEVPPQASGL